MSELDFTPKIKEMKLKHVIYANGHAECYQLLGGLL